VTYRAPRLAHGLIAAALAAAVVPAQALAAPQTASQEIYDALRSGKTSDLRAFYMTRAYRPLWIRGDAPGPEAQRVLDLVSSADLDGLNPKSYNPRALEKALRKARNGSPEALAKAEIMLSLAFTNYVRDVRRPPSVQIVYLDRELIPALPSSSAVLESAAASPSLMGYLDAAQWTNPFYAQLRSGLADYRESWSSLPQTEVSPGPALGPGTTGERVHMLRHRLGLAAEGSFDKAVAAKLRAFKVAHGLPAGPLADRATIAALNQGSAHREQVIRLNLERARALPADLGRRHIVVDAAASRLWLYENGRVRDTMRVIVGKPAEPTPMLAGFVRYAMVNPYWNVPPDLVRIRVAENVLSKGVSYLKTMRHEVLSGWDDNAKVLDPKKVDWKAVAAGTKEVRVRQLPGKNNMMGKMKFMFPNDLGVYLHDTPEKDLFQDADRRFSSGCVRVEDAPRLAKWLFGKPLTTKSKTPEQQVDLPEPVPVYLTYFTVMPAEQGIAFREDVYHRDQAQFAAMASGGQPRGSAK
jgi:murein L,D-transpeptidase YcbB/YkuD